MKIRWNRVIGWLLIIVGVAGSLAKILKCGASVLETDNYGMLLLHIWIWVSGIWFLED